MVSRSSHGPRARVRPLIGLLSIVTLCAIFLPAQPASAEGELHVYNWGDYINPEVLDRFAEEQGVKVTLDTYGSNEEMLAKIQAGATGYDIVFPSVHMHDIMFQLDLLHKSNINQHPDFKNIDRAFLRASTDPNGEWCLPYAWGSVGIFYNKTKVPEIKSWADFFAIPEKYGEKIAILDDMRETIGVGLIMNGKSVNSTNPDDLKAAQEFLLKQKPNISAFTYDSQPLVVSGDIAAAHFYVGANLFVMENPEELAYVIPEEGATMYQEDICILKSSPNKANAKKFLEFYLRPEIAALNVSQQMNGTANVPARALTPDSIRNNQNINVPDDVMKRLQIFVDLGKDIKKYDRIWTKVRTAQ
ncbi:MAG: spermidine/putrescine ABC transporter substrate-binding protein [Proteobacteria bacterium]|nr:spermidine/putrescine ABC transporter substrate-binding protein [Pseudomonadota bacterium]MCK4867483.1 spermidine/putrescine ABC transporter substrate-binding protein [Alphaproteobacteria bacterium]